MPTEKNRNERKQILDELLRGRDNKYSTEDLMNECNSRLEDKFGTDMDICINTIRNDIAWIKETFGDEVIEEIKEGRHKYYRYADPNFSISDKTVRMEDLPQVVEMLSFLMRFRGLPHYEWIDELAEKMHLPEDLVSQSDKIVGFDEMPYLDGRKWFGFLFKAIVEKKALKMTYKDFKSSEPVLFTIHPYFLKQFNRRWFVVAWTPEKNWLSNYAFDRIVDLQPSEDAYIPNEDYDFIDYYEEIVGVTHLDKPLEKVKIRFDKESWNYVKTKPIHTVYSIESEDENGGVMQIEVIPNYELEQAILYYGEYAEVLEPLWLRNRMKERIAKMKELYK